MKRGATFGKIFLFVVIAWLLIGLVYSLAGYIPGWLAGETPTYSPAIGIPLDMVGWPWAMRGDYLNGNLDVQFFATLAAFALALILFLRMLFRKPKVVDTTIAQA